MTRAKGNKRGAKASIESPLETQASIITLGTEEPTTTPAIVTSIETYPLRPLLSTPEPDVHDTQNQTPPIDDTQAEEAEIEKAEEAETKEKEKEKGASLEWNEEMKEQLITTLFEVFQAGGGSDNSFKKHIFELAATNVKKAYKGTVSVTADKCKNKYADFKKKWGHWKVLSK